MTCARLPLCFRVDPDSPLDTLETVLAIARRIGLHLAWLQLRGDQAWLELHAADHDPLALFSARLHNVIGVHDIALNVCMLPNRQKYRTLPASPQTHHEKRPCRCDPPCAPAPPPSPS
jgi:hypothetical protein